MKVARDDNDDDDDDRFRRCQSAATTETSREMHGLPEFKNIAVLSVSSLRARAGKYGCMTIFTNILHNSWVNFYLARHAGYMFCLR